MKFTNSSRREGEILIWKGFFFVYASICLQTATDTLGFGIRWSALCLLIKHILGNCQNFEELDVPSLADDSKISKYQETSERITFERLRRTVFVLSRNDRNTKPDLTIHES